MSTLTNIYVGRFVKVGWFFSLLLFLVVLLYTYTQLPPFITLKSEINKLEFLNFEKSSFFYVILALFVISNLSWYYISKKLSNINTERITSSESFLTENRILLFVNWLNSFSFLINILIILSIAFVGVANSEHKYGISQVSNSIYLSLGAIALWFLLLGYVIVKKEKNVLA